MSLPDYKALFDAWAGARSSSSGSEGVQLVRVDFVHRKLHLRAGGRPLELITNDDETFFAEEADERFEDLNAFLLGGDKPSFERVLDRIWSMSKVSDDAMELSGSQESSLGASLGASLGFSQELHMSNHWHLTDEEKDHLLAQVEEARCFFSDEALRVNDDLATVSIRVDPHNFIDQAVCTAFSISEEPLIITLNYSTPVSPTVGVVQYQNHGSFGVNVLIRNVVEHVRAPFCFSKNCLLLTWSVLQFCTHVRVGKALEELRPRKENVVADTDEKAGGLGANDSVKNLFYKKKSHAPSVDAKAVDHIIGMGFSRSEAIKALRATSGDLDRAVDSLLGAPHQEAQGGETDNFFLELASWLSDRFLRMQDYCLACHQPHRCGGDLPIICGRDLCVFFFEHYLGEKFDARLCPMENCNDGSDIDSSLGMARPPLICVCLFVFDFFHAALCEALKSNGGAFGISLSTLLEMHRHRYLPVKDLLKLHEALKASGVTMTAIESILNPPLCARFERKWKEMREKNIDVQPELAYHGTAEANVPKIQATGLLVPGTLAL